MYILEEQKEYYSKINTGKKLSEETKKKIGDAFRGKALTDEHRQKIKDNHANKHKVYCPQLDETFDSINSVFEKYGIKNINKVLNGERKSSGRHPVTGERLTWVNVE